MNKEAQRIAIAKIDGWKSHVYTDATKSPGSQDTVVWSKATEDGIKYGLPDYLNDLNALQEAKILLLSTRKLKLDFRDDLMSIIQRDGPMELGTTWLAVTEMCLANCQQQAEALHCQSMRHPSYILESAI